MRKITKKDGLFYVSNHKEAFNSYEEAKEYLMLEVSSLSPGFLFPETILKRLEIENNEPLYAYAVSHFDENYDYLVNKLDIFKNKLLESEILYDKDIKGRQNQFCALKYNISFGAVGDYEKRAIRILKRYKAVFLYGYKVYELKIDIMRLKNELKAKKEKLIEEILNPKLNDEDFKNREEKINIKDCSFSVRVYNLLNKKRVKYLGELEGFTNDDILSIIGLGTKGRKEIKQKLEEYGYQAKLW